MKLRNLVVVMVILATSLFVQATTPQVTSTSPVGGPVGTQVQVNGSGFGATQGTSTVLFNGFTAAVVSWSDSQITATVPATSTTGPVWVTVGGVSSNTTVYFNVPGPQVTGISPASGIVGTQVTITGSGFRSTQGPSAITFNSVNATVVSWSDTQIVANVPANATTGPVKVAVNGVGSNQDAIFTMPNPAVSGLVPASGPVGTQVQINGSGFGATQGTSTLQINGITVTSSAWSDSAITATIPATVSSGTVKVTVGGVVSTSNINFTVPPPVITSISPATGIAGTQVTINGSGFQATKGSGSSVAFTAGISTITATTTTWTDTQIVATAPNGVTTGPVRVAVNTSVFSNQDVLFNVPSPIVTSITPTSGPVNTQVQVNGTGLGATQGTSSLKFNFVTVSIISWSDTQIVATVPPSASTGPVQVTVSNVSSPNNVYFTLPTPHITSLSPASGAVGTQVTISGTGFRPTQGTSALYFNGVGTSVVSWSDTQIVATVPSTAATGPVTITSYGATSNVDMVFNMANPIISSLSPSSGPVGTQVQINGSGFGASQGASTVTFFNNSIASIVSWSDTQILATVPATATTGTIKVTEGGVSSNINLNFTVPPPKITSLTPSSGVVGTQVTVAGSGFQATKGSSTITISGIPLSVVSWSDTQIVGTIPASATSSPIQVTVNGIVSNQDQIFSMPRPVVLGVSPTGGPVGTQIQVSGSGFGASQGSSSIAIVSGTAVNATVATWSDTLITATVASGSVSGAVKVTVGGVSPATSPTFAVANLYVSSVSPAAGPIGTQVTIAGSGFGSPQGTSTLSFGGTNATSIVSWTNNQIVANVPTGAISGPVKVTVGGVGSNTTTVFAVGGVLVTGTIPTSGVPGSQVQINGNGFGTVQGTVSIGGWPATVTGWTSTQITANVHPSGVTGQVLVTAGGVASNPSVTFNVITPVITGISPTSGPAGTQIQISGSGFGATQGTSRVNFNGASTTAVVSWSDSLITLNVPSTASTGLIYVTVGSINSPFNTYFNVPVPQITSISPTSGVVGTQVTVNGSRFGATQSGSPVVLGGSSGTVTSWSDTQIVATVTTGARTGPVRVTVNGIISNQDVVFGMPNPVITSLSPASGPTGSQVQINGSGFGATQGSSSAAFNGAPASIVSWSDTVIAASVPLNASSGVVKVTVGGVPSLSTVDFNIPVPIVTSVSPSRATVGSQITVTGSGFHATQGNGLLMCGNINVTAPIVSWSDTQIVATVPANAGTGPITVYVNGYSNSNVLFTLINPQVTSIVPTSGPVGTQVQVSGSNFGATQGTSSITFNSAMATVVSWSDTQIVATVPATSRSGAVQVNVSGVGSNQNINFNVPKPRITGISPASGTVGTNVTITGTGFQPAIGSSGRVFFNTMLTASVVSWSDTQIVVAVPAGSTTGAVKVSANNTDISNQDFVFTMPSPTVTGLVPAVGTAGTQVHVNGVGFGATQGSSSVSFNGVSANVVSWSDAQIVAVVPAAAISGPVQVSEGGVAGNANIYFTVPAPKITSISPNIGGVGNSVTITGTGFQAIQGTYNYASFAGTSATSKSWSDTQIVAVVPTGAKTGSVSVVVNGMLSNWVPYTVPNWFISSLTPSTGPVGTQVTVAGTAFGASQGTSVLTFNGQLPASIAGWSDTQIVATVPVTAAAGPVIVNVGGINSNANMIFNVPGPYVSTYTPRGGTVGTQVTLTGSGFQPNQRNSTLTFNGTPATVSSWSDTQIVATVPTGATTGAMLVTVNSVSSQSYNSFELPNPIITSVTPPEAPAGGLITITGTGFGASNMVSPDGISLIDVANLSINGASWWGGALSWSDTSITVYLPPTATTGPLTLTRYNATSNGMPIAIEGAPTVTGLSPSSGPVGGTVVLTGSGFGSAQRNSTVQFNGAPAVATAWSDTQITAIVPGGASTGPVNVTVASITGPGSDFTLNKSVQVTDSLGHISSYTLTQLGGGWHPTFSTASGCSSCNVSRSLNRTVSKKGNLTDSTDELGRKVTYTYDDDNNVTSESIQVDANTTVTTSYTYNSFDEPLTVTDPLGNVTTNAYDGNGNLLSVTSPRPDANTLASVTNFAYDLKGQMTQITDPLGRTTTLAYNPVGLISSITDAQSNVTSYEYDLRGNRMAVVDALHNRTTFTYDQGDRLTKITYPDTTFVSFAYDTRGRRTQVTDQNGKVTTYTYDDADRLTDVTDAANNVTHYAYDTENELLSITDAAGHVTSFTYDMFRRVTNTSFPSGLGESYVYDAVGNLTSKTDRKGQVIQYIYDALDRLTHKGYPDATGVDYVYDLAGKIKQVSDPTGTYGFAYDNMGRLIGTTTSYAFLPGHTYSNSYTYDAASNRTGFTAPDGSTNAYVYDTLGRLNTLTDSGAGQFTFSYDALSRRTGLNRPNGVNTTYGYDSASRLLNLLHKAGTTTLDGAGYAYDNAGNRTSKTNYLNNTTEQYTYDPLYQLTQVAQGATTTESYSYDPVGNRLSSLGMSPYAYSTSNELMSTPSATFTYDGNGNTQTKVASAGTTTYTWSFENQLTSVALPASGGTVSFKYDPFGRRIQKNSSTATTNYLYDASNSVAEVDASGTLLARYAQGAGIDEPLAEVRAGTTTFYEADGLGSVTSLSDSTSALVNTYGYDAFGNVTASTGAFTNPFQYTARDTDSETGLRYYRARYYDSSIGRFISEDPIGVGGGINFYRYVRNNPNVFTDPYGLKICFFNVRAGRLVCYENSLVGPPILDIPVASGNNGGGTYCKNNPACESIPNRGPIPRGWWHWTRGYTSKPNGRVLLPDAGTQDFGRDLFRSHSCYNPFGPSTSTHPCSAGCVTGWENDVTRLNKLLDADLWNSLEVGDGITDAERHNININRAESHAKRIGP